MNFSIANFESRRIFIHIFFLNCFVGSPFSCEVEQQVGSNGVTASGQTDSNWEMRKNVRQFNQWQEKVNEMYTTHEESHYGYRYKSDGGGVDEVDISPSRRGGTPLKPLRHNALDHLTDDHDTWTSSLDRKSLSQQSKMLSDTGTHSLDRRSVVNKFEKTESMSIFAKGGGLSSKHVVVGSTSTFDIDSKGLDGDIEVKIIGNHEARFFGPLSWLRKFVW